MSVSAEHNVLIDDNGNAVGTVVSTPQNNSFLSNIWKKVWPSRESVKLKYSTNEFNTDDTISEQSKSSGFWSRLSFLASSNEKSESSESSLPESPNQSPRDSTAGSRLDSLYNDNDNDNGNGNDHDIDNDNAPRTPNRKVYTESFFGIQGRVKTRRESILSNNRRFSRNLNTNPRILNRNQNQNLTCKFGVENDTVGFRKNDATTPMDYETKRLSLKSFASESTQDFENQCWNVRSKVISRENFYNVNEVDMGSLYRTGKGSDLTIRCRGKEFQVHSFVLKAQSGQFRRMLFMKSDASPIVIDDMTPGDMEGLLKYMYIGEIDEKLCLYNGEISSKFEFLLQDYEVPLPEDYTPKTYAIL